MKSALTRKSGAALIALGLVGIGALCAASYDSAFAFTVNSSNSGIEERHANHSQAEESGRPALDLLQEIGRDFWDWRAKYAPFTGDDVPRIERQDTNKRDWSAAAIEARRRSLKQFEVRLQSVNSANLPIAAQVDYKLLGSAFARVHWELDINPRWSRDPNFYLEQSVTPVLEAIAVPGPYDRSRSVEILSRIDNIPSIMVSAEENLSTTPAPFVKAAIEALADIRQELDAVAAGLQPQTTINAKEFNEASARAAGSLEQYRAWLQQRLPNSPAQFAVGREAITYFVHQVALLPHTLEELLTIGRQEAARAQAFEIFEENRNLSLPQLRRVPNTNAMMQRGKDAEREIRTFLRRRQILTVPAWVRHYVFRDTPQYLSALSAFGELDDLTSATRLQEDGVRYVSPPSSNLDLFWDATAKDPRPIILHEGVPGHYLQLVLSWANPDPLRRHFYDSSPNEGLGFYCEEMMLQSGLFQDSRRAREIIYRFMLLRAVGIELDIKLALGEFSIDDGARFLDASVGVGHEMAEAGTTAFALTPGVLLSYQTGKSDITRFLTDARLQQGNRFSLRAFHDFLWANGNVPIALLRWQYLGSKSDIDRVSELSNSAKYRFKN
ncbi:MAG TPA: DUF885 family protein [Steroidobacteraceae bacterium]|jgi:uncharacterized protein (DUF885 family)